MLVARVVENLAEALTPLRVLGERMAAGRPLGDRLEITQGLAEGDRVVLRPSPDLTSGTSVRQRTQ